MTNESTVKLYFPVLPQLYGEMEIIRQLAERLDGLLLIGATVKAYRSGVTAHFPESNLMENLKTVVEDFEGLDFTITYN